MAKKRILVVYDTRAGSTAEIAQTIAEVLAHDDIEAKAVVADEARDVDTYDAIVVGSPVLYGRWLKSAVRFVKDNRDVLRDVPVAFFAVGMAMSEDTPENRAKVGAAMTAFSRVVNPVETGVFGGVHDPERLNFLGRLITKVARCPVGDFRDWDAIRAWAGDLRELLAERWQREPG